MEDRMSYRKLQTHPKCTFCEWYLRDFNCRAFPKSIGGIPYEIVAEDVEHVKVIKGQKGTFVFREIQEEK